MPSSSTTMTYVCSDPIELDAVLEGSLDEVTAVYDSSSRTCDVRYRDGRLLVETVESADVSELLGLASEGVRFAKNLDEHSLAAVARSLMGLLAQA
jgi:hypothetical protein